jgi:tetratricopeptide (TPR) repeat protein
LSLYLVVGFALSWLASATGVFLFVKYRAGFTEVRYAHIVGLPFTLQDYRHAKGKFWLNRGMTDANEGRWRDAFDGLRQGLPLAPENEEARMMLARIYLIAGRADMAGVVLVEGLAHRSDQTEYLRTVIGFLFGQQADAQVIEVTQDLLEPGRLDGDARRMVAVSRVYALFNRDRFDEIPVALRDLELDRSIEGRFIEARIAWETGAREASVIMLKDLHQRAPQEPEIYRTLIFYLRELGRVGEARRVALARQWSFPQSADGYVDYIALSREAGELARQTEAQEAFLREFAKVPEALLALGVWAAKEGEAALAWRVARLLPAKSPEAPRAILLALEAELVRGGYQAALAEVEKAQTSGISWNGSEQMVLLGMQAAAQLGLGLTAEAQENLNRVMASPVMASVNLVAVAAHVARLDDRENAANLLRRALELDPLYQPALVALLKIELEKQTLETSLAWVKRLPEMRKPPADLMRALVRNLESDRYLFLSERAEAIALLRARLNGVRQGARS